MTHVIQIIAAADGSQLEISGQYLVSFDFEAHDGRGWGEFDWDVMRAKRFRTAQEALEFHMTSPACKPLRDDGRPNCPLTAATVMIEKLPEEADAQPQRP